MSRLSLVIAGALLIAGAAGCGDQKAMLPGTGIIDMLPSTGAIDLGAGDPQQQHPLDLSTAPDLAGGDLAPVVAGDPPARLPVTNPGNGSVLASMQLYTVVWTGDESLGQQLDAFHAAAFKSAWWQNLSEYGVGPGTARGVLPVPSPRPTTLGEADLTTVIQGFISGGQLPTTGDVTVDFIIPADLQSYDGQPMATICNTEGGHHYETTSSPAVPYLVQMPCTLDPSLSKMDNLTWTDSHEMAEAATDPHPVNGPGWDAQALQNFGEVGDLCNDIPVDLTVDGNTYKVTRVYSARAVADPKLDPCVPNLPGAYFNIGVTPNAAVIQTNGGTGTTTVQLVPFTFGPAGPFRWRLDATPAVATPSSGTNKPGDSVTVTLTASGGAQPGPVMLRVGVYDAAGTQLLQEWISSLQIN